MSVAAARAELSRRRQDRARDLLAEVRAVDIGTADSMRLAGLIGSLKATVELLLDDLAERDAAETEDEEDPR